MMLMRSLPLKRFDIVTRISCRLTSSLDHVVLACKSCDANSEQVRFEQARLFSSSGGDSRGRGGGGGNRDGRNHRQSRNQEKMANHSDSNTDRNRNSTLEKKSNYSEQYFQPAARGELKKHRSPIPKMAGRKGKGHGADRADSLLARESDELMGFSNDDSMITEENAFLNSKLQRRQKEPKTGTIEKRSKLGELRPEDHEEVMQFVHMYKSLEQVEDKEEYYWNEIDYEGNNAVKKQEMFEKLKLEATRDADGNLVAEVDDETFAMFDDSENEIPIEGRNSNNFKSRKQRPQFNRGPEVEFLLDTLGVKGFDKPPNPKHYDVVKPLVLKGPTINDFVESMCEHPTKYGQIHYVSPHPESTREPVFDNPNGRRNPPIDFVESHTRFIYVWGIPPLLSVDEQPGDLDNPLHSLELQKTVATLFDVSPEAVYPASISSAFVGFPFRRDQKFALEFGPMQKVIESPVKISSYTSQEEGKKLFDTENMGSVVLLENLPSGLTPSLLASTLFPPEIDTGDLLCGCLTPNDFVMLNPHTAVLRFKSEEHADNAVKSSFVEQRLKYFGQHRMRYNKARRELVYTGKTTGLGGKNLERKLGPRLIVDGDMPTKNFYLSHATVVHVRNLDPSVTKQDISNFFQPFCALPRDVEGSIEFVTCHESNPTGKAYVGFDEHGDAEDAMANVRESNGSVHGLGPTKVILKIVRDSNNISREVRPVRDQEELLDSLDNWEQYVDPKDLEELLENGISKDALGESLRAIRYQNPTFSSLDQAIRSEALNPEMESGGMYRTLVQSYIETLKECISTPDNPGPIYESLFMPDEELDTEIFDNEVTRQDELRKKREIP